MRTKTLLAPTRRASSVAVIQRHCIRTGTSQLFKWPLPQLTPCLLSGRVESVEFREVNVSSEVVPNFGWATFYQTVCTLQLNHMCGPLSNHGWVRPRCNRVPEPRLGFGRVSFGSTVVDGPWSNHGSRYYCTVVGQL